jgi:hypothetical protein
VEPKDLDSEAGFFHWDFKVVWVGLCSEDLWCGLRRKMNPAAVAEDSHRRCWPFRHLKSKPERNFGLGEATRRAVRQSCFHIYAFLFRELPALPDLRPQSVEVAPETGHSSLAVGDRISVG